MSRLRQLRQLPGVDKSCLLFLGELERFKLLRPQPLAATFIMDSDRRSFGLPLRARAAGLSSWPSPPSPMQPEPELSDGAVGRIFSVLRVCDHVYRQKMGH